MATAQKKAAKLDYLIPLESPKSYRVSEARQVFQDMRDQIGKDIDAKPFKDAAMSIGTHAPKLVSSRNETRGLLLPSSNGNTRNTFAASGNGGYASHMKVILRLIEIEGDGPPKSLMERALYGDPHLKDLLNGFEHVFGSEARYAFEQGVHEKLNTPQQVKISADNYPVFFVPGGDGGDLQVSPSGPIEGHINMNNLMRKMLTHAKKDRLAGNPATYGEWSRLALSGKSQNIIVGGPASRVRLKASMPSILRSLDASIWRYMNGGAYPSMNDDEAAGVLINYAIMAQKLDDKNQYRAPDMIIRQGNRIKFLVGRARDHIHEIETEIRRLMPDKEPSPPPGVLKVLSTLPVRRVLKTSYEGLPASFNDLKVISKLNTAYVRGLVKKMEGEVE